MDFLRTLIEVLDTRMITPEPYGWFHLLWLAASVIAGILLFKFLKPGTEKQVRGVLLVISLLSILAEIYKQFNYTFSVDGDVINADYQWYAFPYQFCSTPIFVLPFVSFLKDSKFRDAFVAYMAFFSLFGGIAVFFYPNDVFISTLGINIQTMIHHGSQIVLGIFFIVHSRRKINLKFHLKSVPVFASLVAIAIIMNECSFSILTSKGMDDTFNMFFISRHFECTLPILSGIYEAVPYLVFSLIYILGFAVISLIIFALSKLIVYLVGRKKVKNA